MGELARGIRPRETPTLHFYIYDIRCHNIILLAKISNDSRFLHAIRHLGPHKVTFYVDSNIYFGHSTARANLPFRIEPFAV